MERLSIRRMVTATTVALTGALALGACAEGKADAPSIEDVRESVEYVEMRRPDGTPMNCLFYAEKGVGGGGHTSYSWMVLDCDWQGVGGEPRPTTSTSTTTTLAPINRLPN